VIVEVLKIPLGAAAAPYSC